jgi:hypothetical protein
VARSAALAVSLAVSLAAATASAQPSAFTMDISPSAGSVGDTYVLTVRLEMPGISGPDRYWHPDLSAFTLLDSQANTTTSMVVDPQQGRQLHWVELRRYFVQPKRTGRLRIGPARARIGGKEFETRSVVVQVHQPGASAVPGTRTFRGTGVDVPGFAPPEPAPRGDVFLHAVADKTRAFVGEQVIVTWLLYTRVDVLRFEPQPPRLDGLWSETLFEPDAYFRYHQDVVGGVPYEVAIVSKRAVFPTEPGNVEIGSYEAAVSSLHTALGRAERIASPPLTLEVLPLPEGAPDGFDPTYVGAFAVEAAVDRNHIDAGESLTLTLTVRGEGAVRRMTPPALDLDGFRTRSPRDFEEAVDTSTDVVRGERVYRYWITPQRGGRQEIPAITVHYFDPRIGRYEQAQSQPLTLVVRGDPDALEEAAARVAGRENIIARDIRLLRDGDAISSRAAPRLYRSLWFWALVALAPLAFIALIISDRIREGLQRETPRSRLRRARGKARQRFRVAEIHLRGNRPAKFFGELARVIQDHIEERLGVPVQSMTRDELREFLLARGFAEATVTTIDEELASCDFARFAPSASGPGEMRAALRRVQELLRAIEKTRTVADDQEEAA